MLRASKQPKAMLLLAIVSVNLYVTVRDPKSVFSSVHYRCQHGRWAKQAGGRPVSHCVCVCQISIAIEDTHTRTAFCDTSGIHLVS